jgi:hypothetical protein
MGLKVENAEFAEWLSEELGVRRGASVYDTLACFSSSAQHVGMNRVSASADRGGGGRHRGALAPPGASVVLGDPCSRVVPSSGKGHTERNGVVMQPAPQTHRLRLLCCGC